MFNAPIKLPLLLGSATILLSSIIASCSSGSTSSEAESLYAQASDAFNAGHYEQSLSLIDSIDTAYPRAIDIRKQCRLLKPQVIERLAALRISAIDSLLALNAYRFEEPSRSKKIPSRATMLESTPEVSMYSPLRVFTPACRPTITSTS